MSHMIHCALVQALGTQLDGSKCTNHQARQLISSMRAAVRHVNSSTVLSKTFATWQEEKTEREMAEAESTRPDQVSSKQLDLQILRRRTQNLKQDVSQRLTCRLVGGIGRCMFLDVHECPSELDCSLRRVAGRFF